MESTTKELVKKNGHTELQPRPLPTLADLISESETSVKQNALMVLLNQEPPAKWIKEHPTAKVKRNGVDVPLAYLPAGKIEYLLSHIFTKWWVEVKAVQVIANSCVVTIRLYVINPITGATDWNDGVGACAIQTDKGAGAMEWDKAKSHGVQIAAPAAETYAFKDAASKFGKLFGKDLSRSEEMSYNDLLKPSIISLSDLRELYELKKDSLTDSEIKDAERIINENESKSFNKLHKQLLSI